MDISFKVKQTTAESFRVHTRVVFAHWDVILKNIREIGNQGCIVTHGFLGEPQIESKYPVRFLMKCISFPSSQVLNLSIGESVYIFTVQVKHEDGSKDELTVSGNGPEDATYVFEMYLKCLKEVLRYAPTKLS